MQIQSLSICVPAGCPNNCKFCVSQMKRDRYTNQIEGNKAFRDLYKKDYKTRLEFSRDNGCNTLVLTGDGEPMANRKFIEDILEWNSYLSSPFRHIDLQTCGVGLVDCHTEPDSPQPTLRWLRNAGVTTIALSISALDDDTNAEYNGTPEKMKVDIRRTCEEIKRYDFNLRLSLNMTDAFNDIEPRTKSEVTLGMVRGGLLFRRIKDLGANQATFRILYESDEETEQNLWIRDHKASDAVYGDIIGYIQDVGRKLERLPFGTVRCAVDDMSVVVDDDCMAKAEDKEVIRYLVLRPDCRLYSKWDEKGSLIF